MVASTNRSTLASPRESFFSKRTPQRDYFTKQQVTTLSPPSDRGLHVYSATRYFHEHKQNLTAMELRLKKLQSDERQAALRIELTQKQLKETQRLRREKAEESKAMTEHVRDLIKLEGELRQSNNQMRSSLKNNLDRAYEDLRSYNRSTGLEIKQ